MQEDNRKANETLHESQADRQMHSAVMARLPKYEGEGSPLPFLLALGHIFILMLLLITMHG